MKTNFAMTVGVCHLASGAIAVERPVDQAQTKQRELANALDVGAKRPVLHKVNQTRWRGMDRFHLRMCRLTVAPHSIVPAHVHANDDCPPITRIQTGVVPVEMADKPTKDMP